MKIILGISGSIAAYKSLELIRILKKNGHEVKVVLTEAAFHFVTQLSCQTLSENEVYKDQFALTRGIKHLSLSQWGDVLVIAPATANIIGKASAGIGDDLLSTAILSFQKPILFVPAMDEGMWQNSIVRDNVENLKKRGYYFLEPITGPLASGKVGKGRFPLIDIIYKKILTVFERRESLAGKKFLIIGGRTEEDLDPVRVITNRSSGKMALELIEAAICREADARLILGEVSVPIPEGFKILKVRTTEEMLQSLKKNILWCDYMIMVAAVSDYYPSSKDKTKIHYETAVIELKKNPDLLKDIATMKGNRIYVGFSLEDKIDLNRAKEKLRSKKLDFIVVDSAQALGSDKARACILKKNGKVIQIGNVSKWELAHQILDECLKETTRS